MTHIAEDDALKPIWTTLPDATVETILDGVLVRSENAWWFCPWKEFALDSALPWFSCDLNQDGESVKAILIGLDAHADNSPRQALWPGGLVKVMRLLAYHPRSMKPAENCRPAADWLTTAPILVFSWLSRDQVLELRPDLTFLLAPSVRFFRPTDFARVATAIEDWPPSALPSELKRFFLGDLARNQANPHELGNRIGPLIIANHLNIPVPTNRLNLSIPAEALPSLYQQHIEQPAIDRAEGKAVETAINTVRANLEGRHIAIFDDDFESWEWFWQGVLGSTSNHLLPVDMGRLFPELDSFVRGEIDEFSESTREYLRDICNQAAFCIVDLRLVGADRSNSGHKGLSGHILLRQLYELSGGKEGVLPLLVFSSSQTQTNERLAYEFGADAYLTKPVKYSQTSESYRLIEAIEVFSHPVYAILKEFLGYLKLVKESGSPEQAKFAGELTILLVTARDQFRARLASANHAPFPSGNPRSGAVYTTNSIVRDVGLAVEGFEPSVGHQRVPSRAWGVLMHFRHIASHPSEVGLDNDSDAPWIGFAVLAIAVTLAYGDANRTDLFSELSTEWWEYPIYTGESVREKRDPGPKQPAPIDNQSKRHLQAVSPRYDISDKEISSVHVFLRGHLR